MPLPSVPAGIETQANAAFSELEASMATFQSNYLQANGRYWQGIKTPQVPPKDGQKKSLEKNIRPSDQAQDWTAAPGLSLQYPIAMAVHTYLGPQGHGYVLRGEVVIGQDTWFRVKNVGPENYRTHDWIKLENL